MNVIWQLDREIPFDEVLGDIELRNEQKKIVVKDAYLDSWFYALLLPLTQTALRIEHEMPEEGKVLSFKLLGNGEIEISYQDVSIRSDFSEYCSVVCRAATEFVGEVARLNPDIAQWQSIQQIASISNQYPV